MQDEMFDAVIVGYGPVGQMAAILLGQMGHRVSIFERWPHIYALPRAVHYDDEIARIFQLAGVTDQVLKVAEPVPDAYEWRNKDGEALLRLDWSVRGLSGWPVANFFAQPELQAVFDERLKSLPTVEVNQGWEVQEIAEQNNSVEVTAAQGHVGQADEWVVGKTKKTVRARYLIGADGANSRVRQHMDTEVTDLGFAFDWLILDVIPHERREWKPMNWQLCDPVRPTTIVGGGPGRRRWEFMRLPGESIEELNTAETAWRLLEPWGITPDNATLERHVVYRFSARWADSWRQGRLLLAGDAAHLMPPFAGQGMCSGLRDAINLAWKLDLVLSEKASDAILDTYESERLLNVRQFIDFSVELGSIICITDPQAAAERDRRMIKVQEDQTAPPPIPNPPHKLGPGILRTDDPHAGVLFIQGQVEYTGKHGRFDDVVGPGFCLLARGELAHILREGQREFLEAIGTHVLHLAESETTGSDTFVDLEGRYSGWFEQNDCEAVLMRPDFYVFGAVRRMEEIPDLVADLQAQLAMVFRTGGK
ncbi:MAG: bifunctional 3-(3-hydroxy-phenyl)propionate/3-hydroxycinnamic acid hydroxylase [Ktedonobacteraceae bacterium]|nr:bifunctional 3-(3-hydroxy-phenyl)propionate/3-hydroxycinnamic acid hydroxylase [Chloroflexota bacterium]